MFKIGLMVECLLMDLKEGIKTAKLLGVDGIQIWATTGVTDPANLSTEGRRELLRYIYNNGLMVSALCGDLGEPGFTVRERNEERIKKTKQILELATDLETNVVTTHIGVIPDDTHSEQYKVMQDACYTLGEYAAGLGIYLAIETGPEKATTLKMFLDSLNSKGLGVNFDPANLIMCVNDDPLRAVHTLHNYIVHTHAKDAIRKQDKSCEVPLGQGEVNFQDYLATLANVGYDGFLTIEREVSETPLKDIKEAVQFLYLLRDKINNMKSVPMGNCDSEIK